MTTLDEQYFLWLVRQVAVENRSKEYVDVLTRMFQTEYVWLIPNDDNRLMDGLELRGEFAREKGLPGGYAAAPCSVLEVMIALSRRMEFIVGGTAPGWAWQFMLNLGFEKFTDPVSPRRMNQVADALQDLVYRNYSPDGSGGFFPLTNPDDDQTQVEIWYQMAAYIDEILPD